MKVLNRKLKCGGVKSISLLTLVAVNGLVGNMAIGASISPFYPIPAYLSSKAETVKPNVMLMLDNSLSMYWTVEQDSNTTPWNCVQPNNCRLKIAQDALTRLVEGNADVARWGFTSFSVADFTPISDNNAASVILKIGRTVGDGGGTPTMPIFYQITRYFQGLTPTTSSSSSVFSYYGDWSKRTKANSPIMYRCQKNFVIVVSDGQANANLRAGELSGDSLFTGLPNTNESLPAFTKRAFEGDFKTTGVDLESVSWNDPNYPLQNIITYTIGFSAGAVGAAGNLRDAAAAGGGKYYAAGDSAALVASLQDALSSIAKTERPPSPSVYAEDDDAKITGAISIKFKSSNWSSELTVSGVNPDGSINSNVTKSLIMPTGSNRNVWVNSPTQGRIKAAGNQETANTFGVSLSEMTNTLLPWLQNKAVANDKNRASLFGDVINGNVSVTDRGTMFVVGANDGMVHAFKRNATNNYAETMVYMPTATKRNGTEMIGLEVPALTKQNYGQVTNVHRYLVDGGTFYRGSKGDILGVNEFVVGSTGRGGAGVYGLDVKQMKVSGGDKNSVLFDITNGGLTNPSYRNLGYTVGTPLIAYVDDGGQKKWITVAANGYFSKSNATTPGVYSNATGRPGLYLINMDGTMWQFLETPGSDVGNGLSSPTMVDILDDGVIDYIYAGDLKGDLYRFDLRPNKGLSIVKIFQGDPSQPITSAPAIFKREDGKRVIVFGTGRLLTEADNSSTAQQVFYGIVDVDDDATSATAIPITKDKLLVQTITENSVNETRTISTHNLGANDLGWKLNLSAGTGERVVYQPVVYGNTVYFTTQIINPPEDGLKCSVGSGGGYLMSLDAETGSQPKAKNSHFGNKTDASYYAGKRVRGYVSNVGGVIMAKASSLGTNIHGQGVAGVMDLNNSNPSSSLGGEGKGECKDKAPSLSYSSEAETTESVTAPACIGGGTKLRTLSWREIF